MKKNFLIFCFPKKLRSVQLLEEHWLNLSILLWRFDPGMLLLAVLKENFVFRLNRVLCEIDLKRDGAGTRRNRTRHWNVSTASHKTLSVSDAKLC